VQLLGDDEADHFRRSFFERLRESAAATHGEVVKNIGDGVMVVFRESAVSAVTCAATMHDKVEALDAEPPAFLRIGVSAGEVSAELDDYFGTPVIEAARLCAAAEPGQTLVSDVVRVLVGSRGGHQFRSVGALKLKGLSEPCNAAAVVRTPIAAPRPMRPPPRKRNRGPFVAFAAGIVVVLVAVGGLVLRRDSKTQPPALTPAAAAGYTPRVEPMRCESGFAALGRGVVCGMLEVPQDRTKPNGKWIKVEYRRYPAPNAAKSTHTIVDVGDPAEPFPSGTEPGELDSEAMQPSLARRIGANLVVIASRGMYRSTPTLDCPEFDAVAPDVVSHAQGDLTVVAKGQKALRACYARLVRSGIDPAHYRLTDQADDVVDLIHALRLHSVDLSAAYDGSLIAFRVAQAVPDAIRSLSLIDPAAPARSERSDATASLGAVFDRYVAICRADSSCRRAYPDLADAYKKAYAEYSAHPRIVVRHAQAFPSLASPSTVPVRLDGGHIAQGLAAVFEGDAAGLPLLPQGIVHPNDDLNTTLVEAEQYPLLLPHFPWGGFLSRLCRDQMMEPSSTSDASRSERPEFAGYDDPAYRWMCDAWPIPLAIDAAEIPSLGVPTFVAREELVPRQSMNALDAIRTGIPGAQFFELRVPTSGGVLGSFPNCYADLRNDFETDPTKPLPIAACEKKESKIAFVTPGG
jgi:pimeloyl-ACP methyl ester carboxylesterase